MPEITAALIYDFDGTLSPDNIQEHAFIKAVGDKNKKFWEESGELAEKNDASSILCYMLQMIKKAGANNIPLTRETFRSFGKDVRLYKGVAGWFKMINGYGAKAGVKIEHYINSSGLKEMMEGTPIAGEFKKIYACSFLYDDNGNALWPAVAVDYTAKTQFLFKISKGIDSISDNKKVNDYMPADKIPIPFYNMIYFGDGETDVPCMKLVKDRGGYSIAVYKEDDQKKKRTAEKLIKENRVNFFCPADYSRGTELHNVVKRLIDKIKADCGLRKLENMHKAKAAGEKADF